MSLPSVNMYDWFLCFDTVIDLKYTGEQWTRCTVNSGHDAQVNSGMLKKLKLVSHAMFKELDVLFNIIVNKTHIFKYHSGNTLGQGDFYFY